MQIGNSSLFESFDGNLSLTGFAMHAGFGSHFPAEASLTWDLLNELMPELEGSGFNFLSSLS